jgi:CBS domain containing-hemolysin-like protein
MNSVLLTVLLIVLLLAANGFFVAAEFALVKARGFRLQASATAGSGAAALAVVIQAQLESYLAACQLGITMASLGLGWIGEPAVSALMEPLLEPLDLTEKTIGQIAFLIGFLLFSSLHIVLGEQVPKSFAIRQPEITSAWIAYPLQGWYLVVYPLNWLLDKASRGTLAMFGVSEATHGEALTSAELKGLVATSRATGSISSVKGQMLQNLLEFGRQPISRIMIARPEVETLDINDDAATNAKIALETGHSRYPVVSRVDDSIVGVLLTRDIFEAMLAGHESPWENLRRYVREPLLIPENIAMSRALEQMRQRRMHMAMVVDEYGHMNGIVTLEDLLEEITGEIHDETDTGDTSHEIRMLAADTYEADGLAPLADVERVIGIRFPRDADTNTLSGLFMANLARLPVKGDVLEETGFRLTVLSVDQHRVGRVRIEALNPR